MNSQPYICYVIAADAEGKVSKVPFYPDHFPEDPRINMVKLEC